MWNVLIFASLSGLGSSTVLLFEASSGGRLALVSYELSCVTVAYDLAAKEGRRAALVGATRRDAVRKAAITVFCGGVYAFEQW